jgi:hypothetical protein
VPDPRRAPDRRAAAAGALAVILLGAAMGLGSRGLRDYDLALLPYTLGVLLAAFAGTYRYAVWLQRPPTLLYWRRTWQILCGRGGGRSLMVLARSTRDDLLLQRFIRRRGSRRWAAHLLFAGGSTLAGAVTFPLVLGWMHFETRPDDTQWYRLVVLGQVMLEFHTRSLVRYVLFNLLNVSAVLVITGALLALRRRLLDPGVRARQQLGSDILPLILLIAISVTGLMLTFSMHVLQGRGYPVISLVHALVVTGTLVYLPFGKFFHVVQRPAQLGVSLYRHADAASPPARCRVCAEAFAGPMQVADLKAVLAAVQLDWGLRGAIPHYADVCPRCRRRLFGFTQGRRMDAARAAAGR